MSLGEYALTLSKLTHILTLIKSPTSVEQADVKRGKDVAAQIASHLLANVDLLEPQTLNSALYSLNNHMLGLRENVTGA